MLYTRLDYLSLIGFFLRHDGASVRRFTGTYRSEARTHDPETFNPSFAYPERSSYRCFTRVTEEGLFLRRAEGARPGNFAPHCTAALVTQKHMCDNTNPRERHKEKAGKINRWVPTRIKHQICQQPCVICGTDYRICVDHIIPVTKGGTGDLSNLQPLCWLCNAKKGNRLNNEELRQWYETRKEQHHDRITRTRSLFPEYK